MFNLSLHKIHTRYKVYHDKRLLHMSVITETSRLHGGTNHVDAQILATEIKFNVEVTTGKKIENP